MATSTSPARSLTRATLKASSADGCSSYAARNACAARGKSPASYARCPSAKRARAAASRSAGCWASAGALTSSHRPTATRPAFIPGATPRGGRSFIVAGGRAAARAVALASLELLLEPAQRALQVADLLAGRELQRSRELFDLALDHPLDLAAQHQGAHQALHDLLVLQQPQDGRALRELGTACHQGLLERVQHQVGDCREPSPRLSTARKHEALSSGDLRSEERR